MNAAQPEPYNAIVHRPGEGRPGGLFSRRAVVTLTNPRKDRSLAGKARRRAVREQRRSQA